MCDKPPNPASPAQSAADNPLGEGGLRTPESMSQLAREVVSDDNSRKRKKTENHVEPDAEAKKPRTATSEDSGDSDTSTDPEGAGSGDAASPREGVEGEGGNTNTTTKPDGISTAPESSTSFPRATPGLELPFSLFGGSQSRFSGAESRVADEEFDRLVVCPDKTTTTFKDIYTSIDTVNSLRLLTLSLRDPVAFQSGILSRHVSFGVLLYGPPGTGKTMLARALAKEAGVKMIVVSYADIQSEKVGVAEKKVKRLFQYARRHHPCIVFIDEAESCFRSRSAEGTRHWHTSFLNQFLTEMDGFDTQASNKPIVVAATNRPFDVDEGILRRLGTRIIVDVPDVRGREAILKLHLTGEKVQSDLDLAEIARCTHDFTGSDLKDLAFRAAIEAVREIRSEIDQQARNGVEGGKRSGADRVIGRRHFLSAKKAVSPAPKADLVAKIADFHARHGSVGGGKGTLSVKRNNGSGGQSIHTVSRSFQELYIICFKYKYPGAHLKKKILPALGWVNKVTLSPHHD